MLSQVSVSVGTTGIVPAGCLSVVQISSSKIIACWKFNESQIFFSKSVWHSKNHTSYSNQFIWNRTRCAMNNIRNANALFHIPQNLHLEPQLTRYEKMLALTHNFFETPADNRRMQLSRQNMSQLKFNLLHTSDKVMRCICAIYLTSYFVIPTYRFCSHATRGHTGLVQLCNRSMNYIFRKYLRLPTQKERSIQLTHLS